MKEREMDTTLYCSFQIGKKDYEIVKDERLKAQSVEEREGQCAGCEHLLGLHCVYFLD